MDNNEVATMSLNPTVETLPNVISDGTHDNIANKPQSEVEAWDRFETSLLKPEGQIETAVEPDHVAMITMLQDKLDKAESIIKKVTELADFWSHGSQYSYNAGQMRYALGTAKKDFVHPSLVTAYHLQGKAI